MAAHQASTFGISASGYLGHNRVPHMTPEKRIHGGAGSNSKKIKMVSIKQELADENGAFNVRAIATGHVSHVKGVALRKKRTPKVSKGFKAKVAAATRSKDITGIKEDTFYQLLSGHGIGQQGVGWDVTTHTQPYPAFSLWSFLPEYFLDAASVLFNKKQSSNNVWQFNQAGMLGTGATVADNSVKFEVVNSFEHYRFRNLSARGFTLKLYECKPKRPSNKQLTAVNTSNTASNVEDALIDPKVYWTNGLQTDTANGYNLVDAANTVGSTPLTYGNVPSGSPSFVKGYATGCTEVFLEPGVSYSYFLQGPSNMEFDMQKNYANDIFQDVQKYSRYLMPVVYSELLATTNNAAGTNNMGRLPFQNQLIAGEVLMCERKMWVKVKLPEEAGFSRTAVTTGQQALDNRKDAFINNNWGSFTAVTGIIENMQEQTGQQNTA